MKKGLTRNERRVLYGLVRHPTLNDRELSEKTRVKHSTITAIRRRLHQAGYFKTVKIPAVNRLGYELTVVGYGRYNPSAEKSLKNRFVDTLRKENKGLYYLLTSPDFYFFISAARDYTSYRKWTEALEYNFSDTKLFSGASRRSIILPYEITKQVKHFDFSRPLSMLYKINEKVVSEAPFQKVDTRRLTKKERTVLRGLVQHPEFTDVALSEEISASRQVISSMKKRFEKNGLVKTTRVVDLEKLGYEIFAFTHVSFNPQAPLKVRGEGIKRTSEQAPQFLMFSGNSETVLCTAHKNYDEYFKARKRILAYYSQKDFIVGEPLTELIALSEAEIPVNCDFSNLMKEAVTNLPK